MRRARHVTLGILIVQSCFSPLYLPFMQLTWALPFLHGLAVSFQTQGPILRLHPHQSGPHHGAGVTKRCGLSRR
jgi:hypothetical protein